MDLNHLLNDLGQALHGVDLSNVHDIAGLSHALAGAGVDLSGLSDGQLDYLLQHIPHGAAQIGDAVSAPAHAHGPQFGSWEKWPSGYMYERAPDGSYTGNYGT